MESVEQLFKQHYVFVCNVINRYIHDHARTEDIAQDIFAELWAKRDQLTIHTSTTAYLRRMAVTRTLNYIRNSKKHTWEELDVSVDVEPFSGGQSANALQQLEETELRQRLELAIQALPEKCRLVFLLSRHEDMSYSEVADHLGISVKTVENQIGKALRLLRSAVAEYRGKDH